MNDEIKEILCIIKSCKQDYDKQKNGMHTFDYGELYLLYNYITNLQQENEYLKKNNPEQNIEHFRVIKENKRKINNLREENKNQAKRNSRQRLANQKQQELILNLQQENERLKEEKDNLYLDNTMLKLEKDIYKQGYEDFKELIEKTITEVNND